MFNSIKLPVKAAGRSSHQRSIHKAVEPRQRRRRPAAPLEAAQPVRKPVPIRTTIRAVVDAEATAQIDSTGMFVAYKFVTVAA